MFYQCGLHLTDTQLVLTLLFRDPWPFTLAAKTAGKGSSRTIISSHSRNRASWQKRHTSPSSSLLTALGLTIKALKGTQWACRSWRPKLESQRDGGGGWPSLGGSLPAGQCSPKKPLLPSQPPQGCMFTPGTRNARVLCHQQAVTRETNLLGWPGTVLVWAPKNASKIGRTTEAREVGTVSGQERGVVTGRGEWGHFWNAGSFVGAGSPGVTRLCEVTESQTHAAATSPPKRNSLGSACWVEAQGPSCLLPWVPPLGRHATTEQPC